MLISVCLQSLQQYHMPPNSLYEFILSNWTGRVNNEYAYNLLLPFNGIFPCQRGLAGYPLVLSSICSVKQSELVSCCHHMIIYVNVLFCFVSAKVQTDLMNCSVRKTSPELQPPPTSPPTKKQRTSLFGHYSLNAQQDPADEDGQGEKKLLSYIEAINSPAVSSSPTSVSAVAHRPEYAFLLPLFECSVHTS